MSNRREDEFSDDSAELNSAQARKSLKDGIEIKEDEACYEDTEEMPIRWKEYTGAMDDSSKYRVYLISKKPLLSTEEEIELAKQIEQGVPEAKSAFIEVNLKLVIGVARRFSMSCGMSLSDLIQEGNIGLIHAVEMFDYRKGFKFSTYATKWISQSIARAIKGKDRLIHTSVHLANDIRLIIKAECQLHLELGRDPTLEEIAVRTGLTPTKIDKINEIPYEPLSIDTPFGKDSDFCLADSIEDSRSVNPLDVAMNASLCEELHAELDRLTPLESTVLKMHFGLDGDIEKTFQQIGDYFGFTRSNAHRIEVKALKKLRDHLKLTE